MTFLLLPLESLDARTVLNEVLYDPAGSDSGGEFVELYNAGAEAVSLAGWRVDFANGAGPLQWQTRWTGGVGDSLAAGAFWLIVDTGWEAGARADAEVSLGLQNGPDAVRLLRPDGSEDRLGYGDLDSRDFYEGRPHAGVSGGWSLARRPDGIDSDCNDVDWVGLNMPTPGIRNFREIDGEVSSMVWRPPSLVLPGETVVAEFTVRNSGLVTWTAGRMALIIGGTDSGQRVERPCLAPDSTSTVCFSWCPAGSGLATLSLCLNPEADDPLELYSTAYHVGVGEVYLNEVMAAPIGGSCEWLEIGNASAQPVDLDGWSFRDEDGDWRRLPAVMIASGALCLVVQDREDFHAWWQDVTATGGGFGDCPPPMAIEVTGGWPSLNNSAPAGRDFADCIHLADASRVTVDHLYIDDSAGMIAGRSLERLHVFPLGDPAGNWRPATTAVGCTPGCVNSVAEVTSRGLGLELAPNPFSPGSRGGDSVLHIGFNLSDGCPAWRGEVYDLWGRRVRDLGGDRLGAGRRDVLWDGTEDSGRQVEPGAYIVLVRTFDSSMTPCGGTRRLAVLSAGDAR